MFLFSFNLFFLISFISADPFIVNIENGNIEGSEHENFYGFRGIQYATAERFSVSKPFLEKWEGVRKLQNYGPVCAQHEHFTYSFMGEENCLTLNVFVPKKIKDIDGLVPVIFYIHGGAFMFGGAMYYGPENIMEHGKMILVTINYRLGILGFLSTEDEVLPGNLGLKDQVEALKWVQRNIRAFNGDLNKVTIVGYSAGGASVHLHYMSKLSKGLFNNGISHSGVATNAWVLMENGREKAHKLAKLAEFPFNDHQKMLKCLKEKSVEDLVSLTKNFQPFLYNPFSPFGVVVEPQSEHAFIMEHPEKILVAGKFKKVPWLLSQVKDEGSYPSAEFYKNEKTLEEINERWEELAQYILDFYGLSDDDETKKTVSTLIRKFYLQDKKISRQNFQAFNDIITDRLFKSDARKAFEMQSKFSPSFMYHFNFKSLSGLGEYIANTTDNFSISHGEDVLLIFTHELRSKPYSKEEKMMINNLINLWYSFAMTNVPSFNGFSIKRSKPDKTQYLKIVSSEEFEMEEFANFGNVNFWAKMEKN